MPALAPQQPHLRLVNSRTPWYHEPEYWSETYAGCHLIALRRQMLGYWCGYIGLPREAVLDFTRLAVHGGFNDHDAAPAGGRSGFRYLAFDCDHVEGTPDGRPDFSPRDFREQRKHRIDDGVYRTFEYVQDQCRQVADQIALQRRWHVRLRRWLRAVVKR